MSTSIDVKAGEQQLYFRAGGEWCYLWTPKSFRTDRPVPVIVHHHGFEGYVNAQSADWLEEDYKIGLLRAVMAAGDGCAVAGSHACGDHCGHPGAVEANRALFETLVAQPFVDPSRIGLMGGGMGGALIWNSVLGPLAGKVKAVAVLQSVASLEAFIRAQRHKWMVLQAYDLPADASDDEAVARVAPHDPLNRLQRIPQGTALPHTAIYHGARDEDVILETHALPLAEALRKAGGSVSLEVFADVEHAVYMMGDSIEARLTQFFSRALV
ncbi:MAG: hypothetical protein EHM35_07910 [Planctomycetaceae bacterium]|nr:MAG: hypothetical protein EHM35_07910 [Planctomycetaceae bacterium]